MIHLGINRPPAWMERSACLDYNPELFFPTTGAHDIVKYALSVCKTCEVRINCLSYSMEYYETTGRNGIWGGMTENQRKALWRNKRQQEESETA